MVWCGVKVSRKFVHLFLSMKHASVPLRLSTAEIGATSVQPHIRDATVQVSSESINQSSNLSEVRENTWTDVEIKELHQYQ